jgi:hypothetical protein
MRSRRNLQHLHATEPPRGDNLHSERNESSQSLMTLKLSLGRSRGPPLVRKAIHSDRFPTPLKATVVMGR